MVAEATLQVPAAARGLAIVTLAANQMCWKSLPTSAAACFAQVLGGIHRHRVPFARRF